MKLIVEKQGENVKAIKIEYTPTEALIINHAMRRYACDEEVNATDRKIMEQMLEVEPIFTDFEHKAEIVISQLRADRDRLQDAIEKIRAEIKEESRFCPLTEGLERALEIIDKYTAEKE
jgi:hypothetical protein